ncbi:TPA: hypothetical protein ACGW7B_001870 [Bacillus nitratireducens]|nr:hypothetical protein bcere0029_9800 [Bacillus cereus AH1272]EEL94870.1 hypothetical protein bcere0030_9770 [Bacillus cereus AH1273]GCF73313.1 hypothetical protein BC2926_08540 [Bacillus cereus]
MDTYIEIHEPATENNEYFLVLDVHDNFENEYYIVSLRSEKQVFVCYAEERIME